MNQFTRSFFDRGLAVLLASLMLYTGLAVPATAQSPTTTQPARYDGETVFQGVFLDDGPVAKLFPEIWENPTVVGYRDQVMQANTVEQVAAGQQALITDLRTQDPTFFDRFGKEMQSGDRIRIQRAMSEANQRLTKLFAEAAERSPNPSKRLWVDTAVAIDYVVAVWAAILAVIVVGGFLPHPCDPSTGCTNSSTLQQDVLVDLVAKRLGPNAATVQ
jgi:SdpC family antimicrobial peptide